MSSNKRKKRTYIFPSSSVHPPIGQYSFGGFLKDAGLGLANAATMGVFDDKLNSKMTGDNPFFERAGQFGAGLSRGLSPIGGAIANGLDKKTGNQFYDSKFASQGAKVGGVATQIGATVAGAAVGMPGLGSTIGSMANKATQAGVANAQENIVQPEMMDTTGYDRYAKQGGFIDENGVKVVKSKTKSGTTSKNGVLNDYFENYIRVGSPDSAARMFQRNTTGKANIDFYDDGTYSELTTGGYGKAGRSQYDNQIDPFMLDYLKKRVDNNVGAVGDKFAKGGFFNGPSHAQGGIQLSGAEVEGDEYNHKFTSGVNKGSRYIFRKELKKDAAKIAKKYKNRMTDKIALESMDREFEALVAKNESMRKRIPLVNKFGKGGKFNVPTQNEFFDSIYNNLINPWDIPATEEPLAVTDIQDLPDVKGISQPYLGKNENLMDRAKGYFNSLDGSGLKKAGKFAGKYGPTLASAGASIGMNLKGLKATPEVEKLDRISAPTVDFSNAIEDAKRTGQRTKSSLYRRSSGLARNNALLLNSLRAGATEADRVTGQRIGDLTEREQNINTGLKFEADKINLGQQSNELNINAQNRAAAQAQRDASKASILDSLRGAGTDLILQNLLGTGKYKSDAFGNITLK